jgi:hypothetical protein
MLTPWSHRFPPASQAQGTPSGKISHSPHAGHWRRLKPGERKTAIGDRKTNANLPRKKREKTEKFTFSRQIYLLTISYAL